MRRSKLLLATSVGLLAFFGVWFLWNIEHKELAAPYATPGWEDNCSEWTALTAALYWEGDLDEPPEGLWAIAWTIRNRVASRDFPRDRSRPNTVRGVVTDGFKPGRRGGCQFSFVCNGAGESPQEFHRLMTRMGKELTPESCQKRWQEYSRIAAKFLENPGLDPTNGANHYWAVTIDPYWVDTDIVPESIIKIGSHKFGWSRVLGEDVPRKL